MFIFLTNPRHPSSERLAIQNTPDPNEEQTCPDLNCAANNPSSYSSYQTSHINHCNLGYFGLQKSTKEERKYAWLNIWKNLPKQCKAELCTFKSSKLFKSLDKYLNRHSFCQECKGQIIKAFDYLVDQNRPMDFRNKDGLQMIENKKCDAGGKSASSSTTSLDSSDAEIYEADPYIFSGVRVCRRTAEEHTHLQATRDSSTDSALSQEDQNTKSEIQIVDQNTPENDNTHLHLSIHDEDIINLLEKAEYEMICHMLSNGHARHAKTMRQAQEEIKICIGIYIYERLHQVWSKVQEASLSCSYLAAFFCENMKFKYEAVLADAIGDENMIEETLLALEEIEDKQKGKSKKKRDKKKAKKKAEKESELELKQKLEKPIDLDNHSEIVCSTPANKPTKIKRKPRPISENTSLNLTNLILHSDDNDFSLDENDKLDLIKRREELNQINTDRLREKFRTSYVNSLW